jgi:hypothetical protein
MSVVRLINMRMSQKAIIFYLPGTAAISIRLAQRGFAARSGLTQGWAFRLPQSAATEDTSAAPRPTIRSKGRIRS